MNLGSSKVLSVINTKRHLRVEMGVYRQLIRRPALPFLLCVSCLLITSPLWLTKQVGTASLVLVLFVLLPTPAGAALLTTLISIFPYLQSPFYINTKETKKTTCFNKVIQGGQVDKLEKLEPLKAGKLMSRLGRLEKQCGQLCDLEKLVVVGGEGEFMGRVKAKVTKLPSSDPQNKSLVPILKE